MAKTEAVAETPRFVIGEYTGPEPISRFDEEVETLMQAQEDLPEEKKAAGVRATLTVNFPKSQTNKAGVEKDVTAKYKRYFQESAKAHNRTARQVAEVDQGDGSVNVTFVLTDLVKRPRKPKDEGVETAEVADTEDAS